MNTLEYIEIIQDFCLFDDIFLRKCLEDDKESIELILSIILPDIKGLKVTSVKTEYEILSLSNRSVTLDAYAVDDKGKLYNIEIQKDDRGATGKRARYHGALMDLDYLKKSEDFDKLPTRYIIIISANGYNCYNEPLKEYVYQSKDGKLLDDETHVIYVNGKNRDNTDLGKLIQDLHNKDYSTMNYKPLADKVMYYKTTEKGQTAMNEKIESIIKEKYEKTIDNKLKQAKMNIDISYISNMIKLGLKATQIKSALNLSDADYNIMYPLALKLAQ